MWFLLLLGVANAANVTLTMSDHSDGWDGFTLTAYTTQEPGGHPYTLVTGNGPESVNITDLLGLEVSSLGSFPGEVSYTVTTGGVVTTGSKAFGYIHDFCGGLGRNPSCWLCNGNGLPAGECDCDGNVLDACGACGVCGGPDFPEGECDCDFTPRNLGELKTAVNLCISEETPTGWCPTLANTTVPIGQGSGSYGAIGSWNVSQVTSFEELFKDKHYFNQPIGDWDTSSVTRLDYTFYDARAFNQPIGDWNTSSVTTLAYTFTYANAFNQPIGDWNTSSVTTLAYTFSFTNAFNQPIGDWDTSSVSTLLGTFGFTNAFNQPIGDWNTSSVSTLAYTFYVASAFNQPIGDWDISSVTTLYQAFYQASAFNQDLSSWVTTLDTDMIFQLSAMCDAVKGGACNCAGDMRVNGVCQVSGCRDQEACNYNALAITDGELCDVAVDASCETCVGTTAQVTFDADGDGVCDDVDTCIGGDCVEDKVVVEYDGQRYEACEGATVKVLKNGTHNIWEDSEAVIEPLSTSAVTTTLLGAQEGTTRTFYCSAHPEKTFQISCCDLSKDNPATYINNQCCQCPSS